MLKLSIHDPDHDPDRDRDPDPDPDPDQPSKQIEAFIFERLELLKFQARQSGCRDRH